MQSWLWSGGRGGRFFFAIQHMSSVEFSLLNLKGMPIAIGNSCIGNAQPCVVGWKAWYCDTIHHIAVLWNSRQSAKMRRCRQSIYMEVFCCDTEPRARSQIDGTMKMEHRCFGHNGDLVHHPVTGLQSKVLDGDKSLGGNLLLWHKFTDARSCLIASQIDETGDAPEKLWSGKGKMWRRGGTD